MNKNLIKELTEILTKEKQGNMFDFVINNYWLLSKEELKELCKEAFALLYEKTEAENIKNGKKYDYFVSLHKEYLKTLKENTSIFEEE